MQDTTPCEPAPAPAPAPAPLTREMATNSLQIIPTDLKKNIEERTMNVSPNTNNCTKEENQTKEDSIKEDRCSEPNIQNLNNLVHSSDSEDGNKEVNNYNEEEPDDCKNDIQYACPICDAVLFSSHDFTIHIRSHNNNLLEGLNLVSTGKAFACRLCGKILSSANSLDRHLLTHSGERPFKCKICSFSFITAGNLHRHMRTHSNIENGYSFHYDSDESTDSHGSCNTMMLSPSVINQKRVRVSRTASEFNNNIVELSPSSIVYAASKRKSDTEDIKTGRKRKCDLRKCLAETFDCSLCDKTGFLSSNLLEMHIEECHPEYKVKCDPCNLVFKNHRGLNLHRYMVHHTEAKQNSSINKKQETVGFKDLTFVDFSSQKFPHIARIMCEQSVHHASSLYHRFQCEKCNRAFPCRSALGIHRQSCGQENYASSGESCHQDNDLSSSDNETPTDLSSADKRISWSGTKVSESSDDVEEERKRYNFFAGLDLQNTSMTNSSSKDCPTIKDRLRQDSYFNPNNADGKDLADIQSIISVASAGGLLHDLSKSPTPTVLEVTPPDSGSRVGIYDSAVPDEEQQDCFAAEFRKMKLRGEFPCRLCNAIFPNLRALKGHNRVHLSSNAGQNSLPYRCNMCPHFSSDKSALIRHMRTHNGDRPYECALCHYAFTTKANCERHLRNRHAKMTREDVKKSIIYHPSEDPTNEIENKPSRDDVKRSLFCEKDSNKPVENRENLKNEKLAIFVNVEKSSSILEQIHSQEPSAFTQVQKIKYVQEIGRNENAQRKCLDVGTMTYEESEPNHIVYDNAEMTDKSEIEGDVPLDLSMDVLDLSKKKNNADFERPSKTLNESDEESKPQDLSKKSGISAENNNYPFNNDPIKKVKLVPASLPMNNSQDFKVSTASNQSYDRDSPTPNSTSKLDLSKFYPTTAHNFYLNNTSTFPPFTSAASLPAGNPYSPYFIPPPAPLLFPANANHDFIEMKERLQKELIRGLQLTSGGSLVLDQIAMANASDRIQAFHQQAMAEFSRRMETTKEERKVYSPVINKEVKQIIHPESEKEPRNQEVNQSKLSEKLMLSKVKQDASSSVKMVIKNGVLIPKQKQRRYRTERPFSCEHCSARFTLRSNMERHIKQQHPQFWTQRQRNAANMPTRRNHSLSSKMPQTLINHGQYFPHSGLSAFSLKSEDEVSRSSISNDHISSENKLNIGENKTCISEEVKNAIAQQLKSKLPPTDTTNEDDNDYELMDDEEDEDLVIDEEIKDEDVSQAKNDNKLEEEILLRKKKMSLKEENLDLASVSRLLDNASTQTFRQYFHSDEDQPGAEGSEEDEEGLVAAGSTSEGCNSGSDENRSESEINSGANAVVVKKKSAYSLAPNRVSCPYCFRKFPWSSSLRRHVLTHTGQKPYKCSFCPLLFTTKSNCDRHLLRKHGGGTPASSTETQPATSNDPSSSHNATNYIMRNVPERPYKCKNCPSSTFSTLSNLKKHLSTKHQASGICKNEGTQSGYESQGSISEEIDVGENELCKNDQEAENKEKKIFTDLREIHPGHSSENPHFLKTQPVAVEQSFIAIQPSDLPFKCHLCEGSFAERQEALDHIRDNHCAEFQLLVSKGALEVGASAEDNQGPEDGGEESLEQLRGKFPDYANRKVMCAFCLRRFWSAEDLRRHMRTHTGERPFSCDICRRRFTLKHSMLRHRKKHSFPHSSVAEETSPVSDEDINGSNTSATNHNNNNILSNKPWMKSRMEEESDLISNLLGIQDKTIVDKMLISKSADDAAKLLGVKK